MERIQFSANGMFQCRSSGLASAADSLGRTLVLGQRSYLIVGIMAEEFEYPTETEVWLPPALTPKERADRSSSSLMVIGLLKPGTTVVRSASELQALAQQLETRFPLTNKSRGLRSKLQPIDRKPWLLIEWPKGETEPAKYWLSILEADTKLKDLVAIAKQRWIIERDYEELKQELGLGHYEGRGWRGLSSSCHTLRCLLRSLNGRAKRFPPLRPRRQTGIARHATSCPAEPRVRAERA